MHFNINYTCCFYRVFFFSQCSHAASLGLTHVIRELKQRRGRRHGNKNDKKAIDLARAFSCMSLSSLHDYDVKFSNCTVCGGRLWKARFQYLPKPFGNFHEKVDRMNNVFHLTQLRFVYAFVTSPKFKMVAQISS